MNSFISCRTDNVSNEISFSTSSNASVTMVYEAAHVKATQKDAVAQADMKVFHLPAGTKEVHGNDLVVRSTWNQGSGCNGSYSSSSNLARA